MAEAVEKAYRAIRDGVVSGAFPRGSHLTAQMLAEATGLSRTPVREAMRRLDAEGVLRIVPNRGAFVANWSEENVEEYFELCVLLESFATELAARRATADDLAELAAMVDEMNALVGCSAPPVADVKDANDRFHKKLMAICGNGRLEQYLNSLIEAELVSTTLQHYSVEELRRAAIQHAEIVDAIRARDPAWARSVMTTHLLSARHTMIRTLRGDGR